MIQIKPTVRIALMALLTAIGVMCSTLIWFPAGVAKAFPVQHAINVISAVLLGPGGAVLVAFAIAVLRNILGMGTLLAFPGGMIGALIAGWVYRKTYKTWLAVLGEIVGTGLIGSLVAVPIAVFVMGKAVGAVAFIMPFLISSVSGALLAGVILTLIRSRFQAGQQASEMNRKKVL